MTTTSRPDTTVPVHAPRRSRWLAWLLVVLLVVGLGASFLVGRATKADPPADVASASALTVMNDFAVAVNKGDAKAIAALFTEDAVSVGPGPTAQEVTALVGPERIGESLASLREAVGLDITNPGTATQRGNWVSQPVDIAGGPGLIVVQLIDGKIAHQIMVIEAYLRTS